MMVADVIANPLSNFTWWRYDNNIRTPVSSLIRHQIDSTDLQTILQINVSHSRDYGKYAVELENSVGSEMLVFELTAKCELYIFGYFPYVVLLLYVVIFIIRGLHIL